MKVERLIKQIESHGYSVSVNKQSILITRRDESISFYAWGPVYRWAYGHGLTDEVR